jgi:hypothetical protein
MVMGTALDTVLSWGVKIDVVLVQSEQIEMAKAKTESQMPLLIKVYEPNEDVVAFGLRELSKNQNAANIVMHASEDAFTKTMEFVDSMNITLIDDTTRWIPVSKKFQKWLPAKSHLKLRRSCNESITYTGLKEAGVDLVETISDGNVVIESPNLFWVGETIL